MFLFFKKAFYFQPSPRGELRSSEVELNSFKLKTDLIHYFFRAFFSLFLKLKTQNLKLKTGFKVPSGRRFLAPAFLIFLVLLAPKLGWGTAQTVAVANAATHPGTTTVNYATQSSAVNSVGVSMLRFTFSV